jgi:hypothetical protein
VDDILLHYTERLVGLEVSRCEAAVEEIRSLDIDHLSDELCDRFDIDAMAAAVLLAEGLQELESRGIERTKLVAKVRGTAPSGQRGRS